MMKLRTLAMTILVASSIVIWSGAASAGGYGFYAEYGRNIATSGGDIGPDLLAERGLADRNEVGFGFALDTNVAADRLFNYRMDFGYHGSFWADSATDSVLGGANGLMFNNAFGFGILRTSVLRLWLGPAFRMNFDWYGDVDLFDYQFGVGPQAGLNFHVGPVSFVLSSAYNYKFGWFIDTSGFNLPVEAHRDHYVSVNLAVLFRSGGDQF